MPAPVNPRLNVPLPIAVTTEPVCLAGDVGKARWLTVTECSSATLPVYVLPDAAQTSGRIKISSYPQSIDIRDFPAPGIYTTDGGGGTAYILLSAASRRRGRGRC
jgi:hypothetical protein